MHLERGMILVGDDVRYQVEHVTLANAYVKKLGKRRRNEPEIAFHSVSPTPDLDGRYAVGRTNTAEPFLFLTLEGM